MPQTTLQGVEPPTYEEAANLSTPASTTQLIVEPDTLPPPSYRSSTQTLNENWKHYYLCINFMWLFVEHLCATGSISSYLYRI